MDKLKGNRIFISYSWDSDEHKAKILHFVNKLRSEGLEVVFDGDMRLGERITQFMEKSLEECEYVLLICTPLYKQKADQRTAGVGYENMIITGELYEKQNEYKFIPILFSGSWKESIPIWMKGKLGIDLSNEATYKEQYKKLVQSLKQVESAGIFQKDEFEEKQIKRKTNQKKKGSYRDRNRADFWNDYNFCFYDRKESSGFLQKEFFFR